MTNNNQPICRLGSTIESAIALIDPKGTDIQISQAMSIVRLALSCSTLGIPHSPCSLYERARRMYPQDNPVQDCSDF